VESSAPINTASRYLPISTNYDHFYIVHEWIPCAHSSTPSMRWRRFTNGSSGGYTTVTKTTSSYCDGYVNATNWTFNGSSGGYIQMVDNYPTSPAGIRVTADYLWYH
jgi:hypothetical protein